MSKDGMIMTSSFQYYEYYYQLNESLPVSPYHGQHWPSVNFELQFILSECNLE